MLVCPNCSVAMQRTSRTLAEKFRRTPAAFRCKQCGHRGVVPPVKHCWRCGTDLDRRKRTQASDYVAAALALWPYSCRRCGTRRYRWGRRSA